MRLIILRHRAVHQRRNPSPSQMALWRTTRDIHDVVGLSNDWLATSFVPCLVRPWPCSWGDFVEVELLFGIAPTAFLLCKIVFVFSTQFPTRAAEHTGLDIASRSFPGLITQTQQVAHTHFETVHTIAMRMSTEPPLPHEGLIREPTLRWRC